jgi:hypothetical protein
LALKDGEYLAESAIRLLSRRIQLKGGLAHRGCVSAVSVSLTRNSRKVFGGLSSVSLQAINRFG